MASDGPWLTPGTALGRGFAQEPPPAPLGAACGQEQLGTKVARCSLGFLLLSRRSLTTDGLGTFQFSYVAVLLEEQDEALREIH